MTLTLSADPLPIRLDEGGTYRVGESGVRLDTVVYAYTHGSSAEQIVREFPTLALQDVYAVIAYYLNHRSEVEAYLEARRQAALETKAALERDGYVVSDEKKAEIRRRFEELLLRRNQQ
jgi:uncharacterized protein (DUF433 family)